jgi:hypothetical protein
LKRKAEVIDSPTKKPMSKKEVEEIKKESVKQDEESFDYFSSYKHKPEEANKRSGITPSIKNLSIGDQKQ